MIGLLGILLSSSVIYFLLRRIRLANCQNLLIINVAVSDTLACLVGILRGLGILDSKFVGAPDGTTALACAIYTISLNTFANSGMLALLPLTIDRAIAVTAPLRHKSLVTKKTCLIMCATNWLPIFANLVYDMVAYSTETMEISYQHSYHRCVIQGRHTYLEHMCLLVAPFFLILLLYTSMMFFLVRHNRQSCRFLVTATGIIMSSLVSYFPTVITNIWSVPMSYEVSQIFTVTFFYTNGIVSHPTARKYLKTRWKGLVRSETKSSVVKHSGTELGGNKNNICGVVTSTSPRSSEDRVCLPIVNNEHI